jgi:hypothetical protein
MAATVPSLPAANIVEPTTNTSSGKFTAPMRATQACLATTSPLTACSADGWGLAGEPKYGIDEQPGSTSESAINIGANDALEIKARDLKDW